MSFAISSIISDKNFNDPEFIKNHWGALLADAAILTTLSIIAGLILGGVIHIGIPIGVGTLGHVAILGGIAGVGAFALFDGVLIKHHHLLQKPTHEEITDEAANEKEWLILSQDTLKQNGMGRLTPGLHTVYLNLNSSKNSIDNFIVDKYENNEQLKGTYQIEIDVREVGDNGSQLQVKFRKPTFLVEAREWRSGTLANWGEYLGPEEDAKIKELFAT